MFLVLMLGKGGKKVSQSVVFDKFIYVVSKVLVFVIKLLMILMVMFQWSFQGSYIVMG